MNNTQPKQNKHLFVGELGEDIACRFLKEKDFKIIDRNYRKKWGELDVICEKGDITHFVEVKTLSKKIKDTRVGEFGETSDKKISKSFMNSAFGGVNNQHQPEDNIHPWKIKRLSRAIQSYLLEKKISEDGWRFDIVAVLLDSKSKTAKIRFTENIPLF